MVEIVLTEDLFVNNVYTYRYGTWSAVFTIVDEEFAGDNRLGRVNRVTILVTEEGSGTGSLCTSVIGLGDGVVGIRSDNFSLLGKLMTHENMAECVVMLYGG
jgi:hypothetical protein